MSKICWEFPPLGTGDDAGHTDAGKELFKGRELIDNLAREICQNSLDAKNPEVDGPVIVEFSLKHIDPSEHEMLVEFNECLDSCKSYWESPDVHLVEYFEKAKGMLEKKDLPVLVASDYNTTGLTNGPKSAWKALAHSNGVSMKPGADSAGSYGIGKAAPFSCSDMCMVFYGTHAIDGFDAFQGTAQVATMRRRGKRTQPTGHYLNLISVEKGLPILPQDECSFRDLFPRNQFGTDIIIVGFNAKTQWRENILRAAVSNFLVAIAEGRLVVKVDGIEVNAGNLDDYTQKYADAKSVTTQYVYEWHQALHNDGANVEKLTVLEPDDIEVHLISNEHYHRNIAFFKNSGMLIRTWRPPSFFGYAAVVLIKGKQLSELLLKAEPPRHNRWDYTIISNKQDRKLAKESLARMDEAIKQIVKEQYEITSSASQDSGEGSFLPDAQDDGTVIAQGTDLLQVNQKLLSSSIKQPKVSVTTTSSQKGKGERRRGDTYGDKTRATKSRRSTTVDGDGKDAGAKPSDNGRPLVAIEARTPASLINEKQGLYKIRVISTQDMERAYVTTSAYGEDSSEDLLHIEKCMLDGKMQKTSGNIIGPVRLKKDVASDFFITFSEKEKMVLRVIVEGEKRAQ